MSAYAKLWACTLLALVALIGVPACRRVAPRKKPTRATTSAPRAPISGSIKVPHVG